TTGIITAIIPNAASCDSTITINLTINKVDTAVTQNGITLTAKATGATYQWLDCNNSLAALTNETKQSFTATQNGSYAVKIIQNTCIDTSACFVITNVGVLKNTFSNDIVVYPNPTSGFVTVNMGKVFANFSASLHDLNGKLISQSFYKSTKMFSLHLEVPSGVYLLTINDGNSKATIRLIKQ
ncbi:MAG: T9SS type A sorting domain-containing protein, partial [Bacteroidia bacterium]|nr:T9SS type A sorting domain-containing protein [Bacteroidia bacterium]